VGPPVHGSQPRDDPSATTGKDVKNMKKLLIGATIALSVLLPLGVAYAAPPNDPDPNPNNGQDCEENGNNGGNNAPHCTTTTVTVPPTTTTQSPGNPCDDEEIVDLDNCPTTTTTVSPTTTVPPTTTTPPCVERCQTTTTTIPPCVESCQTTTTAVTVPPPTTTASPTTAVPPACPGSVRLGDWYGDPQINITLRGKGTFKVTGGIQRFSHQRTVVATLDCGETLKVTHYKVKNGHALKVYKDGKLVIRQVPPRLN